MQRFVTLALFAVLAPVLVVGAMACGSGSSAARGGGTIEPLGSSTAGVAGGAARGRPRGAAPAGPPAAPDVAAAATEPPAPAATESAPATRPPRAQLASDGSTAPTQGRWIEVDVTRFVVRLMDGTAVVREIAPVAVGAQVDTGAYASTQTGLFHVNNKIADLAYDAPYDTYISHWVGFDPDKANGFHSFLKDKAGNVVDAGSGRISNGCIRTGEAEALFAFAEIGMPVWVHG